jgi:hypothetical protein
MDLYEVSKGTLEDALAEAGGALEVGLDLGFDLIHHGESLPDLRDDLFLLRVLEGRGVIPPKGGHNHGPWQSAG